MGRLDISALRYLSKDDFRTLQAVEQGMKNHDLVPVELISSIAALKHGGAFKCLSNLLRIKLIKHDRKRYDGYSLNYLGYDFLAFNTLRKRGVLRAVGRQIGVGKESDVFVALDDTEEKKVVIKLHRLGRTSFRKIKEKRDYHQHRKFANWLYLSRLAAAKEIAFMRCLHEAGFPVPEPIDQNRHCVVMSLLDAYPLTQIRELRNPGKIFAKLMELHIRLAQCGLVHCDFNEFNVMINDDEEITLIDFPQMVSTSHMNAAYYFERDVECLRLFFERRYGFVASSVPKLSDCSERLMELDKVVAASGFTNEETQLLDEAMEQYRQTGPGQADEEDGNDSDDDEDDDSEEGERVDDDGNAAGDENSSGMVVAAAARAGVDAAEGSEGGVAIGVAGKDKGGKHGGGGGGGPGRDSGSGRGPSGPEDSVSVLGEEYTRLTVCDDAPGDDDDTLDAGASGGGGAIGSSADADNALAAAAATAAAAAAAEGSPGGEQYDSEEAEGDGEEGGDGDDADGVDGGGRVGGGGAAGGGEGGGIMSGSYDRDDDIRRAWRFSGRPAAKGAADGSSGRGGGGRGRGRGAAGGVGGGRGGLGAAPGGGGAGSDDWRKLARNRVKDRERRKVLDTIRDCT